MLSRQLFAYFLFTFLLSVQGAAAQDVRYVSRSTGSDTLPNHDGLTWATAWKTLQRASYFSHFSNAGTVYLVVEEGSHTTSADGLTNNLNNSERARFEFRPRSSTVDGTYQTIIVEGGYRLGDPVGSPSQPRESTVLSGYHAPAVPMGALRPSAHVVHINVSPGQAGVVILRNLTIANGVANTHGTGTSIENGRGGGILVDNSVLTPYLGPGQGLYPFALRVVVDNCLIRDNKAHNEGGGIAISSVHGSGQPLSGSRTTDLMVCSSAFERNYATIANVAVPGRGGAISSAHQARVTISHSIFRDNGAVESGGAISLQSWGSSATLPADRENPHNATIVNCLFTGNRLRNAYVWGSAISTSVADRLTIVHSTLATNYSFGLNTNNAGGAITLSGAMESIPSRSPGPRVTVLGSIIVGNRCPIGTNCSISFGAVENTGFLPGDIHVGATDIYYPGVSPPWLSLGGNIDVDPLFVDIAQNDFGLLVASPCVDATGFQTTLFGELCDFDESGTLDPTYTLDLSLVAGRLSGCSIDMGCYEAATAPCGGG